VSRHSLLKGIVALHPDKDCADEQPDMNEMVKDGEREDSSTSPEKALQLSSLSCWQGDFVMVGWDYAL